MNHTEELPAVQLGGDVLRVGVHAAECTKKERFKFSYWHQRFLCIKCVQDEEWVHLKVCEDVRSCNGALYL